MTESLAFVLNELLAAIEARVNGATPKQRANVISPRMEDAIAAARKALDEFESWQSSDTEKE